MARPPLDQMPQERLALELRRWIDAGRHALNESTKAQARNEVIRLVLANRVSSQRQHVLHNLGCRRRRWIYETALLLPPGETRELLWAMTCGHDRAEVPA